MKATESPVRKHDALQGLRVVDFTIVMSGPYCTRMLADCGADVIKIEAPDGDAIRQRPPMRGGMSTYFASMNCGKRSVILDLKTADGRKLAQQLAAKADVVVENFRPGVMRRLGLDYASLARVNPRLIYCSLSGFGQEGPLASRPAYAPVIHATCGYDLAHMEQQDDATKPANNGIFTADVLGATHAASAINLALYDRERTGRGQFIDLALMDGIIALLVYELQLAQFPRKEPRLLYRPVRARDGYVMVAPVSAKNLEALAQVVGHPEWATDKRFATVVDREMNWMALLQMIEEWTLQRSAQECEDILMAAGVPSGRYRPLAEVIHDPHLAQRGTFAPLGSDAEPYLVANLPYRLSAASVHARKHVPKLGEHTAEVMREVLALEPERVEALAATGAFGRCK